MYYPMLPPCIIGGVDFALHATIQSERERIPPFSLLEQETSLASMEKRERRKEGDVKEP